MDCQSPLQWVFMQQLEFGQLQMISLLVGSLKIAHLPSVSFIDKPFASFILEGCYRSIFQILSYSFRPSKLKPVVYLIFLGRRRPFIMYYTSAVAFSLSVLYMSEAGFLIDSLIVRLNKET